MTLNYASAQMRGTQFSRSSRTLISLYFGVFGGGEGAREFISLFPLDSGLVSLFLAIVSCLDYSFPSLYFLVISLPINSCLSFCLLCLWIMSMPKCSKIQAFYYEINVCVPIFEVLLSTINHHTYDVFAERTKIFSKILEKKSKKSRNADYDTPNNKCACIVAI